MAEIRLINSIAKIRQVLAYPVFDPLIRRKANLQGTPLHKYSVRIARSLEEYEDAFSLLHVAYAYLGIESVRTEPLRMTPHHVLPEATVFVAYEGNRLVGTMTVTLDSPAGLPLDQDYPNELSRLRDSGAHLVELGSLAVVMRCRKYGVTNLLNIAAFHWSINYLKATDCVIGIHPSAGPWHRAVYAFTPLGEAGDHAQFKAPVLGMRTRFPELVHHLKRKFPKKLSDGQTYASHVVNRLPGCVSLPIDVSAGDLTRWKLPRDVFQELFTRRTNRLRRLDSSTREYLRKQRSDTTMESVIH